MRKVGDARARVRGREIERLHAGVATIALGPGGPSRAAPRR